MLHDAGADRPAVEVAVDEDERLLSASDVAKRAGVTPATVRQWETLGRLPAQRTAGGMRLFREKDVGRWLRERAKARRGR
jgi:excisionase family DNA binding protein